MKRANALANQRVPYSRPSQIAAYLCTIVLGALSLALIFVPWQQSANGHGRVVAYAPLDRQQIVKSPIDGRVMTWHVREGSRVKQGAPLLEISDNDPAILDRLREERDAQRARIAAAEARVAAIEGRLNRVATSRNAAVDAADRRASMAVSRLRAAEQAERAAQASAATAELNLRRQTALFDKGLTSKRALELAELDALRTTTDRARAAAALQAALDERSSFSSDRDKVSADGYAALDDARATRAAANAEIASARAELARIEVRLARQQAQSVTAPRDGVVLRLLAAQGTEYTKAGDPLLILVPDTDDRAVELWLDGRDVPLVSEGRHVRLQFEGWPAVQFVGWPSVAVGTFGGTVALVDATDDGKGKFRVVIVPDDDTEWPSGRFLRQGTRANGWIMLNRVRLGFELWRLLNGFPPTISDVEPGRAATINAGKGSPGGKK